MDPSIVLIIATAATVAYAIRQARKCYEAYTDFDDGFNVGYEEGQIALRDDMQSVKEALGRAEEDKAQLATNNLKLARTLFVVSGGGKV